MAIETPVDVLRRLREENRQKRLSRAQELDKRVSTAKTPGEKSEAVGSAFGEALYRRFNKPDLEQDPAVLQAKARQQWLNVAPDDVKSIRANIKASAEAGDYEVSNYLTKLYYQAQQLKLKEREVAADEVPTAPKLQSKLGKQVSDVDKLRAQGKNQEADELEARIGEEQAQAEAVAREKQMKTYDTALSNSFGVNLEADISHESVGGQYQSMVESAYDINKQTGKGIGKIRNDMRKYFKYDAPSIWTPASFEGFRLTDTAEKELEQGKAGFGYDDNTGRYGLYKLGKDGVATDLISYVEENLVPENLRN